MGHWQEAPAYGSILQCTQSICISFMHLEIRIGDWESIIRIYDKLKGVDLEKWLEDTKNA